jgi:hypothetical protein
VSADTDFKKREEEIDRCRQEIAALQERIKRLVTKRPSLNAATDDRKKSTRQVSPRP